MICKEPECDEPVHAEQLCESHYRKAVRGGRISAGNSFRACEIPGCGRKHAGHGLCSTHLMRWRRGGPIEVEVRGRWRSPRSCTIRDCERAHKSRGYCAAHYKRWAAGLDVSVPLQPKCRSDKERMSVFTDPPNEKGCQLWNGSTNPQGYGVIYTEEGKLRGAHRVAYELANGVKLGRKEPIHHKCANPLCVAPDHLQKVSQRENNAEMLERTWYKRRIAELEAALAAVAPEHELLGG